MAYFGTFGKPTVRAKQYSSHYKRYYGIHQYSTKGKKNLKSFEDGLNL